MSDQATDGVKYNVFSVLGDVVAFCNGACNGVRVILKEAVHDRIDEVLNNTMQWINRGELFHNMGLNNHSTNRKKLLDPLLEIGWKEMEYPEKPTHPQQRYRITPSGKNLKKLLTP